MDLTRPIDLYLTFGSAPRERLGREVGLVCLLRMLRAVANLPNLSRAPGDAGQLKLVTRPNGVKQYMTPDLSDFSSYPTSKLSDLSVVCATWEAVLIRSDAGSYDVVLRRASGGRGCRGEMSWLGVADGFGGYSDSCL